MLKLNLIKFNVLKHHKKIILSLINNFVFIFRIAQTERQLQQETEQRLRTEMKDLEKENHELKIKVGKVLPVYE